MTRQTPVPEPADPVQVLLVEDDVAMAALVHDQLEATSDRYRCVPTSTLDAAVAALDAGGIQIALVDLSLPDSAGLDTLQTILAHADGVPVVVLTGFEDPDLSRAAIAAGARDFVVKGVDRHRLVQVLEYALE